MSLDTEHHNHDPEQGVVPGTGVSVCASTLAPELFRRNGQKRSVLKSYLTAQLDRNKYMSAVPIVSFFISGLVDAVAFNTWGCFVGMQTGNTVFVALGIAHQPMSSNNQQWTKLLTAIGFACLGCAFFNFVHRYPKLSEEPSSRIRWVMFTSWVIQCSFITSAAILTHYGVVSNQPAIGGKYSSGSLTNETAEIAQNSDHYNYVDLVAIALLAFQSAGPVCLSRILRMSELPTIAVSSVYHSWTSGLFHTKRSWRESTSWKTFLLDMNEGGDNRQLQRASAIFALFLGAVVTSQMYRGAYGVTTSLFVAAAVKGLMAIVWCFWPRERTSVELFCRCETLVCSICGSTQPEKAGTRDTSPSLSMRQEFEDSNNVGQRHTSVPHTTDPYS